MNGFNAAGFVAALLGVLGFVANMYHLSPLQHFVTDPQTATELTAVISGSFALVGGAMNSRKPS